MRGKRTTRTGAKSVFEEMSLPQPLLALAYFQHPLVGPFGSSHTFAWGGWANTFRKRLTAHFLTRSGEVACVLGLWSFKYRLTSTSAAAPIPLDTFPTVS